MSVCACLPVLYTASGGVRRLFSFFYLFSCCVNYKYRILCSSTLIVCVCVCVHCTSCIVYRGASSATINELLLDPFEIKTGCGYI